MQGIWPKYLAYGGGKMVYQIQDHLDPRASNIELPHTENT